MKMFRLKDPLGDSHNIPIAIPIVLILMGTVHFIINGAAIAKLQRIEDYNWGIFSDLGLADTYLLPIMILLMLFDMGTAMIGVYFMKHIEPDILHPKDYKDWKKEQDKKDQ